MGNNRLPGLIKVFKPNGRDWMLYRIKKDNPLTFHHIQERSNEGLYIIDNGALLTIKSHKSLHIMQRNNQSLYEEWQNLFRDINSTKQRPNLEHITRMRVLREKSKECGYE